MVWEKEMLTADTIVIYECPEDHVWIANSLRTDQIGTGDGIVDALADCISAIKQVCELAKTDKSVSILHEAPEAIQKMAIGSQKLPHEMYEVAYRRVHNQWPENLSVELTPSGDVKTLSIDIKPDELVSA